MSPRKNKLASNLKVMKRKGTTYYYYVMPDKTLEPLGKDISKSEAIDAATALNIALAQNNSLVKRITTKAEELLNYNPQNPPMSQVLDDYKTDNLDKRLKDKKLSKGTYDIKLYKLNEYANAWNKKRVQELRPFDLATFLKEKTAHAQGKHLPLLKDIFLDCIQRGYINENPARDLKAATPEKRKRKRHTLDGFNQIRSASPDWLKRAMDIALYSLQRRGDLTSIHIANDVNVSNKTIRILQQKTRNYEKPVFIEIDMGEQLWKSVQDAIASPIACPYLIHCRPKRMDKRDMDAKPHPFAVMPDYLTKSFKYYRDLSGAYGHLEADKRPTFHDIRALGILLYYKASYHKGYIMALAGHAKESTTDKYIEGHEEAKPIKVAAGLDIAQVSVDEIDWANASLPADLSRLIEDN